MIRKFHAPPKSEAFPENKILHKLYEGLKNVSLVRLKNESKLLKGADKAKKVKAIKEMNAFILTLKKQITMLKKHI